ncbi:hypothetical protein [Saezia sanguinis]|uniref:hypothetical protein n=1 Tax=Saezia sanguinis TaxID=1965230 RepID=UPI003051FBE6
MKKTEVFQMAGIMILGLASGWLYAGQPQNLSEQEMGLLKILREEWVQVCTEEHAYTDNRPAYSVQICHCVMDRLELIFSPSELEAFFSGTLEHERYLEGLAAMNDAADSCGN